MQHRLGSAVDDVVARFQRMQDIGGRRVLKRRLHQHALTVYRVPAYAQSEAETTMCSVAETGFSRSAGRNSTPGSMTIDSVPGPGSAAGSAGSAGVARGREAVVLAQAAQPAQAVKLQELDDKEGKQGKLEHQRVNAGLVALAAQDRADAKELLNERRANAKETTAGEGRLPIELAILGAIGSSCALPLLAAFLGALRRRV
jgi:hypothetical protein